MSSEFDMYFQQFLDGDQEPFDISEYCNTGDYMIDAALEAQALDHPAADAGNGLFDPDASVGVSEPNQASLHEGQPAVLPGSNQSESAHPKMIDTALASSGPPYKCTEANCRSKAKFTTLSQLMQHVLNIHLRPLLCTVPGCTYRKPFGKKADLRRHVKSKHEATRLFTCPDESCPGHFDGFKRKDKLLKHLREDHPQVRCQQTHCSTAVADCQQQSHIDEAHGPYECALGQCQSSPPSNFTQSGLMRHMRNHHKINAVVAYRNMYPRTTIRSEHFLFHRAKHHWEECSVCCKTGGVTASIGGDA